MMAADVFTRDHKRAMVAEDKTSWFQRAGAWAMAGINIGVGQFNVANFLSIIAVGAVFWFGNLVTQDHEKISDIASSMKNLTIIQDQIATTNTLIIGFQHDQSEVRARLNCIQGVGSADSCPTQRRRQ